MAFFEVEFPRIVGFKAQGGPTFNTTVNVGFSGYEQRNRNWSLERAKYTIDLAQAPPSQFAGTRQAWIDLIHSFFLNVGGKADAFRWFDHVDHQATGEQIGVGDGSTLGPYQLIKTYTIGGRTYTRTIKKPVTAAVNDYTGAALTNTVVLYDNGSVISAAFYSVAATTGIVTFAGGHAPGLGHVISADCQFHYPVRFDTDEWQMQIEESDVKDGNPIVTVGSLPLIEVRI